MTTNDALNIMVRIAQEQGERTAAYGDHAFHTTFNRLTQLVLVADCGGRQEGRQIAERLHATMVRVITSAIQAGKANPAELLRQGLVQANEELVPVFEDMDRPTGEIPGLSCVAGFIVQDNLYVAHAGDCRLYVFRGGKPVVKTADHTHTQRLVDKLEISPQEASAHPDRFLAIRKVGMSPRFTPDVRAQPIRLIEGDRVLLCSDGIHDPLEDRRIVKVVTSDNPMVVPDRLVESASVTGTGDDRTALLLAVGTQESGAVQDHVPLAPAARMKEPQKNLRLSFPTPVQETPVTDTRPGVTGEVHMGPMGRADDEAPGPEQPVAPPHTAAQAPPTPPPESEQTTTAPAAAQVQEPVVTELIEDVGVVAMHPAADPHHPVMESPREAIDQDEMAEHYVPHRRGFVAFLRDLFSRRQPDEFPDEGTELVDDAADGEVPLAEELEGEERRPRFGRLELVLLAFAVVLGILFAIYLAIDADKTDLKQVKWGEKAQDVTSDLADQEEPGEVAPTADAVSHPQEDLKPESAVPPVLVDTAGGTKIINEIEGLDPSERACKLLNGSASQCTCYMACLVRLQKALKELEGRQWTDSCTRSIEMGGQAYNACRPGEECTSFEPTVAAWEKSSKAIEVLCASGEIEHWRRLCEQPLSSLTSARIKTEWDCEDYRDKAARSRTACAKAGSSGALAIAEKRIENECKVLIAKNCKEAVDAYEQIVNSLEKNIKRLAGNQERQKAQCRLSFKDAATKRTAHQACDNKADVNVADDLRLTNLEKKKEDICTFPPPPPTGTHGDPGDRRCLRACDKKINQVIAGLDSGNLMCKVTGKARLGPAGDAFMACKACDDQREVNRKLEKGRRRVEKECRNVTELPLPDVGFELVTPDKKEDKKKDDDEKLKVPPVVEIDTEPEIDDPGELGP